MVCVVDRAKLIHGFNTAIRTCGIEIATYKLVIDDGAQVHHSPLFGRADIFGQLAVVSRKRFIYVFDVRRIRYRESSRLEIGTARKSRFAALNGIHKRSIITAELKFRISAHGIV